MAHKYRHVSTGDGFYVKNGSTYTQVINQDGEIKGDIKEALAQGSIYIGNASGVTSELSVKGDTKVLVGNGTTATSVALSGDATMANTGAVTVGKINGVALGTTTATSGNLLIASGTSWETVAMSGDITIDNTGATTIGAAKVHASMLGLLDDTEVTIGTTTATAATKISLEFDETTTGVGQFIMGSASVPQVLNTNPGANVIGHQINLLHSAGAGDCTDLYGSYTKVAISGDGDSGTTLVGSAPRAYAGTAGGTTVAQEVYGTQPWAKHSGTGTITAMSGVSAALILNDAEAFEATNSINAGHFHIKTYAGAANGTVTSSNFDGVMIEAYSNVTGLDSMLNLSNGGTSTTSMIRMGLGTATNVLETNDAAGISSVTNGNILNDISSTSNAGYIKVKIGTETRYIALYELKS
ncbi:MAG: hypothetical protein PHS34_07635 [Candidatus Omnitrophica bacterium]|nr:hypothetical protein [Candidatus Omnitrophota bacterium]